MKLDFYIHILMAVVTVLILVFNFHNVFGNLEASLVVTTWVTFTAFNKQNKKINAQHVETHKKIDALHETIRNQNDSGSGRTEAEDSIRGIDGEQGDSTTGA